MTNTCLYRIELDRADGSTVVEYRKRKRPTTNRGLNRQHDSVVNQIAEELRYYQIQWKRYTVTRVPSTELTQGTR